jgi:histidinol-phosphate/aromatic aminotransferase/cobyric acid decarboxylase-like protein
MVPSFARMNGLEPMAIPLLADLEIDVAALLGAGAEVTYVCRPNNPTGTLFRRADMETIIERAPGLVIVDEAYVDFSGDDLAVLAIESGRAVVLRTLSKVFGLAGLRVGFAIGPAPIIAEIQKSRGPYKVNGLAEAAALAVLESGRNDVDQTIARTLENREKLIALLEDDGHVVLPSAANFVLVAVPDGLDAKAVAIALRARGVAVRPFPDLNLPVPVPVPAPVPVPVPVPPTRNQPQKPAPETHREEWFRVTIGPWPMMQRFHEAFRAVTDG